MMQIIVCDLNDKICMVHRYNDCPGKNALTSKLQHLECLEDISEIKVKQWQTTDQTALNTMTFATDEFIELAV